MLEESPLEGGAIKDKDGERDWVAIARDAYSSSTTYLDANYRKQWERNVSNFRGQHPAGSKYHTDKYKYRSRLFRPKTRISTMKNEAAFAAAMFSTLDVVAIDPHDVNNPVAAQEAEFWHSVLNYRLTRTIPWFRLSVGAFQETQVYGAVISKQDWEYEEKVVGEEVQMDPFGAPMLDEFGQPVVMPQTAPAKNQPRCKLLEIENCRIDPAADWTDPINGSPYFIEMIPMYVVDIMDYMQQVDPKTGGYLWHEYTKEEIAASRKSDEAEGDSTRSVRTGGQTDKYATTPQVQDFETVWVHLNFIRMAGEEVCYYTLGTDKLLSDPKPVAEMFPHLKDGERPYVLGVCTIEPHKVIPSSMVELSQDLQSSANDLLNQRRDNINLVLNKRYLANRGANTDINALQRNVPGGVILTDDVNSVRWQETVDVTGSAYHEQDRLNADFDSLTGTMDTGSVQTTRALHETVGGMNLLSNSANATTEYILRTFVETWCEPVIRQLVALEQANEDTPTRQRFMVEGLQLSGAGLDVSVNVGFGSTEPQKRLSKLVSAITVLSQTAPKVMGQLNAEEIAKEVFGAAGYRDGKRFMGEAQEPQQDPKIALETKKLELQERALDIEERKVSMELHVAINKLAQDKELGLAKIAAAENMTIEKLKVTLGIKQEEIQTKREIEGVKAMNFQTEMAFKSDTGRDGI
jgi:hypothetical protein